MTSGCPSADVSAGVGYCACSVVIGVEVTEVVCGECHDSSSADS